MGQTNVVSIGGIDYDSRSGMPVAGQSIQPQLKRDQSVHAKGVHATHQRSTALNRQFVKKTQAKPASKGGSMDMRRPVKRSPHISKFAADPVAVSSHKRSVADVPAVKHPVVTRTQSTAKPAVPRQAPSAREIKHAELGKALVNAKTETKAPKKKNSKRAFNVAAASLGVLMITGYFTYVNMPNLSVRVAAAQAGIDAAYPEYRPVGYRMNGPVAYQDGQVSMKFASNSGPLAFDFNQARSSWDSSALLEKYVDPRSEGKYATYNDGGLTIYTYGTDAAWVNGGILYTVEGSATLSNEQIRKLATSL